MTVNRCSFLIVCLACLTFISLGLHNEARVLHAHDFKQPYASARCLLFGCDPYSEAETAAQFVAAGGNLQQDPKVFAPDSALYPPSSLAVLAPIAILPYPVAHFLWLLLCGVSFSLAALLISDLCRPYRSFPVVLLLAVFVATSAILIMLGQVSGIVISLAIIGLWCFLRERCAWLGILCLALSLTLKPHVAGLLVCYLLIAGKQYRAKFWRVVLVTALLSCIGIIWAATQPASRNWLPELQANLAGNTSSGNVGDPTPANPEAFNIASLQSVTGEFFHPHQAAFAAYLITTILLGVWLYATWRIPASESKHLLALAGLAAISILPIYHRQYDTRLLLLAFPAVAMLWQQRRVWGTAGLALMTLATLMTSHSYLHLLETRVVHLAAGKGALVTILLMRPLPVLCLVLAIFFVAALMRVSLDNETKAVELEEIRA
ncbi:DUF2029 domain-containing protein [Alloacidobacterium dinghuense]|uniref:DUF2029 domain-containing protein n=1 Tax=Alloacidobacterium dinghuense TaxID=2763107 RepID=A0A7G8BG07_9BACT|nr:glycosyltransferase family 87 protein [Alloacidobacterium dinghuense]QNI31477.1 DUF2029 domain-containing protein [Alloacidobacterium dinghuense]